MNNYFVILAAGKGKRFNKYKPKQFFKYKNRDIIDHSIQKSLESKLFKKIIIVTNNSKKIKKKNYSTLIKIVKGGKERSDSSLNALKYIKKFKPTNVLIHDAARPNFSIHLLKKLIKNLKKNKAVIPVYKPNDSTKYKFKNKLYNLERKNIFFTQTPQAFRFKDLYKLSMNQKNEIVDEASMYINSNLKLKFINGEPNNNKITYKKDIKLNRTYFCIGFDIHRLIKNKKLYL